jgi:hypothetical protein
VVKINTGTKETKKEIIAIEKIKEHGV